MSNSTVHASILTVEQARDRIVEVIRHVGLERVALSDAHGRVLAEPIVAAYDIPARDNTAMDGYAVRAGDVEGATREKPVTLEVVETLPAGYVASRRVEPGTAIRIMTGAPMPDGADSVVIVEVTESEGDTVRVFRPSKPGASIRRRGEDVRAGDTVLLPGADLRAGEIGQLASLGRPFVTVARRPTVAVLSTGDELLEVGAAPEEGKLVNSNAFSLASLAREAGALATVLPIARATPEDISAALVAASEAAVVVTSGGVSVGDFDFVKAALDALGAETNFWRVAMKPGKPVVFAELRGKPFFGLPGNPVSCMVGFHLFVWPALRKMMGVVPDRWMRPEVLAELAGDVRSSGDRRNYQRAVISWRDGRLVAETKRAQGSGVLSSMVAANGLVIVPEGAKHIAAGETVRVQLIGEIV
ncbi:MAG: molybdopterin molybdotransferase MoeA [Blastocatellia bacterium]|nr:molybdopterin molybdotransferase MoeA [Blastocatellia bacterium]